MLQDSVLAIVATISEDVLSESKRRRMPQLVLGPQCRALLAFGSSLLVICPRPPLVLETGQKGGAKVQRCRKRP